jgi:hypothetical protein
MVASVARVNDQGRHFTVKARFWQRFGGVAGEVRKMRDGHAGRAFILFSVREMWNNLFHQLICRGEHDRP